MLTKAAALVSQTMTTTKRCINMPRYKTRSNEINAVEVQIENAAELKVLIGDDGDVRPYEEHEFAVVVVTQFGVKAALPGDYVFSDIEGLHVISKKAFEAIYEPVVEAPAAK